MNREYKVHAFYILLILFSIIIGLISVKWSEIPGLVGYITFALTVSSLSLAVLAIIYSIYSNSTLSQNVVSLEQASRDVSDTAKAIDQVTTGLALKVEAIPSLIEIVGARVEHTHQLIEEMAEKPSETLVSPTTTVAASTDIFGSAIRSFSVSAILSLYACSVAFDKEMSFKMSDLCEKVKLLNRHYMYGFLVGVSCFGALKYKLHQDILTVIEINDSLNPLIKKRLEEIIELKDKYLNVGNLKESVPKAIKEIENYFAA